MLLLVISSYYLSWCYITSRKPLRVVVTVTVTVMQTQLPPPSKWGWGWGMGRLMTRLQWLYPLQGLGNLVTSPPDVTTDFDLCHFSPRIWHLIFVQWQNQPPQGMLFVSHPARKYALNPRILAIPPQTHRSYGHLWFRILDRWCRFQAGDLTPLFLCLRLCLRDVPYPRLSRRLRVWMCEGGNQDTREEGGGVR